MNYIDKEKTTFLFKNISKLTTLLKISRKNNINNGKHTDNYLKPVCRRAGRGLHTYRTVN